MSFPANINLIESYVLRSRQSRDYMKIALELLTFYPRLLPPVEQWCVPQGFLSRCHKPVLPAESVSKGTERGVLWPAGQIESSMINSCMGRERWQGHKQISAAQKRNAVRWRHLRAAGYILQSEWPLLKNSLHFPKLKTCGGKRRVPVFFVANIEPKSVCYNWIGSFAFQKICFEIFDMSDIEVKSEVVCGS